MSTENSPTWLAHLNESDSRLELVDVAPIQLENAKKKLAANQNIGFHHQDSSALTFPDASFDQSVVFFLLHEQPEEVRRKTVAEAIRAPARAAKSFLSTTTGRKKAIRCVT